MLRLLLKEKEMSLYQLEKSSNLSHATLSDIYNEKNNLDNCSIITLKKVAQTLGMSIDELYDFLSYNNLSLITYDESFDLFKSNIVQELKRSGDILFLKKYLSTNEPEKLFKNKHTKEAVYFVALFDYLCKKRNLPLVQEYDKIREICFSQLIVPKSIYLLLKTKTIKISSLYKEWIPEFLFHNIVEAELDNVA